MRPRSTPGLACAAALALAACAGVPGAGNSGWSVQLDGGCDVATSEASAPALDGGVLYVGSRDGAVYAMDAATGERRWRFQTGGPVTATPVIADGRVLVGSWDHRMYAIDPASGTMQWSFDAQAPVPAGAVLHAGTLIFGTHGRSGRLIALDAQSGRLRWAFVDDSAHWPNERPVLRDGVLYVTNWDAANFVRGGPENARAWVHAIDADTGHRIWTARLTDAWPSPPAVTRQHVLFMTSPRRPANTVILHALDRRTGRQSWTYEGRTGGNYWKSTDARDRYEAPRVARDRVAIFASDVYAAGVDLATGAELWRLSEPFRDQFLNQYDLGPLLYVISGDTSTLTEGKLYGIDPLTGRVAWSRPMPSRNRIQAILDGTLYIRTSLLGVTLVAVDGRSGAERATVWRHPLLGNASYSICAGPVRDGNRLFISTRPDEFAGQAPSHGYLYGVTDSSPPPSPPPGAGAQ
jgi:outer membrane protein assembly factor BamB